MPSKFLQMSYKDGTPAQLEEVPLNNITAAYELIVPDVSEDRTVVVFEVDTELDVFKQVYPPLPEA
jgi:hypothetical protein